MSSQSSCGSIMEAGKSLVECGGLRMVPNFLVAVHFGHIFLDVAGGDVDGRFRCCI